MALPSLNQTTGLSVRLYKGFEMRPMSLQKTNVTITLVGVEFGSRKILGPEIVIL